MLILATVFQCLDPALTIAACLSSKPVFLSPMEKRDEATAYGCPPLIRARCKLMYHKEPAHASQPRKVTSLLTFVRTTNACEYARKNRLVPCVPSVQMYVTRPPPSSSPRPQLIHFFFFSFSFSSHAKPVPPELHLGHDDPRHQRPTQRPPLSADERRARPSGVAHLPLVSRAERTRGLPSAAQGAAARGAVPARGAHRAAATRGEVCAHGEWRSRAGRGRARVAGDRHARRASVGAPRQRAVCGDALALRYRREL